MKRQRLTISRKAGRVFGGYALFAVIAGSRQLETALLDMDVLNVLIGEVRNKDQRANEKKYTSIRYQESCYRNMIVLP